MTMTMTMTMMMMMMMMMMHRDGLHLHASSTTMHRNRRANIHCDNHYLHATATATATPTATATAAATIAGGYQHFKVTLSDRHRGMEGEVMVERMGGDMVLIDSEILTFDPTNSYVGASAGPLLQRFFPSVLRRLRASADKGSASDANTSADAGAQEQGREKEVESLLADCVVCTGRIEVRGLDCEWR